jgi:CRISPR system Cascade subunit CasA
VEALDDDPVMAIDWPRADFRLASLEFLIGLLAVAYPSATKREWEQRDENPPDVAALDTAFAPLAELFNLDGDGPRFMQDFEQLDAEPNDVATLLIEAPGEQALKKNTDLLNKRGQVQRLSRAAAAMALYTLQTFAPAGGAGNRTGLRGGGPLTTLAIPPGEPPLWRVLWANVPLGTVAESQEWPRIFPWLAKTRTSEKDAKVAPASEGDRLAFWGMPRRIRLVFAKAEPEEVCDLTGMADEIFATGWRQRPYGANYTVFEHPLSPYYKQKPKDTEYLPVHPQPAGIGYKDFLGLLFSVPDGTGKPAACIATYTRERKPPPGEVWRILAAGYDMDNMKARGFVEAELPVFSGDDAALQAEILSQLIAGAESVAGLLRAAVRNALFSEGAKTDLAAGLFATLRARFWRESEPEFYRCAWRVSAKPEPRDAVTRAFLGSMRSLALKQFDETAPITGSDHPARVARAAKFLALSLNGYGKAGDALFKACGLVPPVTSKKRKAA